MTSLSSAALQLRAPVLVVGALLAALLIADPHFAVQNSGALVFAAVCAIALALALIVTGAQTDADAAEPELPRRVSAREGAAHAEVERLRLELSRTQAELAAERQITGAYVERGLQQLTGESH